MSLDTLVNFMTTLVNKTAAFGLTAMLLVPALASADAPSVESANFYTNGIKIGAGRLHPFIDLEMQYDSAAGFFGTASSTSLSGELIGHIRPGLRFELMTPNIAVNFDGWVDRLQYTGFLAPGSERASRWEAGVDLGTAFNREGGVEIDVDDHLSRSDHTTDTSTPIGVLSFFNDLRLAVPIHPGGRALEITPHVAWDVELFQPLTTYNLPVCDASDLTCLQTYDVSRRNYNDYHFGIDAKWKFLPKTAVVLDTTYDTRTYAVPNSNPIPQLLKVDIGLVGLITSRLSTVAKIGYGFDLAGSGASTLLANLEFSYLLVEGATLKLGYLRALEPVPQYGIYGTDRGYFDARVDLSQRVLLRAGVAVDYLTFYGGSNRHDLNVSLDLGPEVAITKWFHMSAGYTLGVRKSDAVAALPTTNFTRHQAYLRLTFTY